MRYLYVDNFRGFTNSFIPMKEVNFFVGENSTGKTSIMALLNLLHSPHFWFLQAFNRGEVQFGHFRDIVSVFSKDRSYFRFGFVQDRISDDFEVIQDAFLLSYVERDGQTTVSRYHFTRNNHYFEVLLTKRLVKYKRTKIKESENIIDLFKKWTSQPWEDKNYRQVEIPKQLMQSGLVGTLPSILEHVTGVQDGETVAHIPITSSPLGFEFAWLAPIRSKPKRTYDGYNIDYTPEGDHTPYMIRKILSSKSSAQAFNEFLKGIGNESGLFDSIKIKRLGRSSDSPFEVRIVLDKHPLRINNVGYGVSQALPVIVELFARPEETSFGIQQPEVHLHPRAQAALGDLIFRLAKLERKTFYIETHSDFTIDRFRTNFRKSKDIPASQVLFFERTKSGNQVHPITILPSGEYDSDQPSSFRDFFVREELRVLGF